MQRTGPPSVVVDSGREPAQSTERREWLQGPLPLQSHRPPTPYPPTPNPAMRPYPSPPKVGTLRAKGLRVFLPSPKRSRLAPRGFGCEVADCTPSAPSAPGAQWGSSSPSSPPDSRRRCWLCAGDAQVAPLRSRCHERRSLLDRPSGARGLHFTSSRDICLFFASRCAATQPHADGHGLNPSFEAQR